MSYKMNAGKKFIAIILLFLVLLAQLSMAVAGESPGDGLLSWLQARRKTANELAGTVEEVCEDKIMILIQEHRPSPGDELLVYSYQFAKDPEIFPEVAVLRVETIKQDELQGRVLIRGDKRIKPGDVVKFPPADYLFFKQPAESEVLQNYQQIISLLVAHHFKIVEGNFSPGFPYGYIVKLATNGRIIIIHVESVFDHHIFFMQKIPCSTQTGNSEEQ